MSENVQETVDPGTVDVAAIAQENAQLRQQLLAENERLRQALADSQAQTGSFTGLTDEDVRRLEHPEEFVAAENDQFRAQIADLQAKIAELEAAKTKAPVEAQQEPAAETVQQ